MRKITLTAIVGSTIVLLPLALPASTTNSHVANLVSRGSGSPAARWRARQAHRIPFATCTTTANDSFVALPGDDVAGGDETATLGGRENAACDEASAIGSGYGNSVASSGRVAFQSFIGGGALNAITEGNAFIGAGSMNAASGEGSAIVGGGQISTDQEQASRGNLAGGEDSFVGAGDLNVAGGNGSFVGAGGATYALGGATTPGNTADGVDSFIGAKNPIGLLIRGVVGDENGTDRYLLTNNPPAVGVERTADSAAPSCVTSTRLPPGLHNALLEAVREGRTITSTWLAERDISSKALVIARDEVDAEAKDLKSSTPLCDKLEAEDPVAYRVRLERILADLELPAILRVEARLEHPMLFGMCRSRLEIELSEACAKEAPTFSAGNEHDGRDSTSG